MKRHRLSFLKSTRGSPFSGQRAHYFRDLSAIIRPDYFGDRADHEKNGGGSVKRCVLGWLLLALVGISFAGQAPSSASPDTIFWWQAGGISGARLKQLAQQLSPACRTTTPCGQALGKTETNAARTNAPLRKLTSNTACACSTPAAQIAALVRDKKYAAAEEKVRTVLHDDAGNPWAQFVLGTILRQQNRFEEAFDVFTESAKLMPNFPETHSQLSYLFYRDDDSDNAIAEARTALSMDPKNAEAYRYLGLALYSAGRYDAALNAFEQSLIREPANADVYYDMGITLRDQGDLRRAAIAYRHALSLRPDFWEAHSNLGVVLHDQGRLEDAVTEYRAAKRLNPQEASIRNNLGNTYCDQNEFDSAVAEFQELSRQHPEWEGGHNCLARAYMAKRNYPSAIRELEAAIRANPTGAAEHRVMGQALLLLGRDREAVSVLRKAVSLNPDSAMAHHYLGTAFVNVQQLADAEKEFREALRLDKSAQNHYSLAACLVALNRYEEALGELEIAARMDPSQDLYRARMQEVVKLITASK
jgi:tetratricopeptide (TPR) repeat protein